MITAIAILIATISTSLHVYAFHHYRKNDMKRLKELDKLETKRDFFRIGKKEKYLPEKNYYHLNL